MNKLIIIVGILLVFLACNNSSTNKSKPTVTVSIVPQKFFVNQIAGSWLNVNVMVPPGSSPATYEPTPIQMKKLSESQLYFKLGHIGFEKGWMSKLASINSNMKIIDTSKDLDLIEEEEFGVVHSDGHGHSHVHEGFNPHTWLSPELVKEQAKVIYNELLLAYPEHADSMKINLDAFIVKIDSTNRVLEEQLRHLSGVSFIVYHPVWTYLAHDYNMNQVAIEFNGKEATAKKLKEVIDFARANNIKVVFAQKEFDASQAKSIANEINGEVVLLNPLDYDWFKVMHEFGQAFEAIKQ